MTNASQAILLPLVWDTITSTFAENKANEVNKRDHWLLAGSSIEVEASQIEASDLQQILC